LFGGVSYENVACPQANAKTLAIWKDFGDDYLDWDGFHGFVEVGRVNPVATCVVLVSGDGIACFCPYAFVRGILITGGFF
jgi:hypothetical protein